MTIFNNLKSNGNNPNQLKPKPMVDVGIKMPLSDLLKKHWLKKKYLFCYWENRTKKHKKIKIKIKIRKMRI